MSKYRENPEAFAEGNSGVRPSFLEQAHLDFLDELRESGKTNMFGARPYLMREFDLLSEQDASAILGYWMQTFRDPNRR